MVLCIVSSYYYSFIIYYINSWVQSFYCVLSFDFRTDKNARYSVNIHSFCVLTYKVINSSNSAKVKF